AVSMAAAITARADKSYVYPDAVIMHHEIRAYMGGSLKETEEFLEMMKKWWRRLATPIAEKMGLTLEEFRKRLYEENSNGNWQEFGTKAVELNWADHVIQNIEEAGIRQEPEDDPPSPRMFFMKHEKGTIKKDNEGNYYRKLPPLRPYDFYYMYDPTNFYRW
ncbi:MAG: peptidase S14, partial [bacterium]